MSSEQSIEQQVTTLKDRGNAQLQQGQVEQAVSSYGEAIALYERESASARPTPQLAVLLSNRSAALLRLKRADAALVDAERCVALNAGWAKAHLRRGMALHSLQRYSEAVAALDQSVKLPEGDTPATRTALNDAKAEETRTLLLDAFSGDVLQRARLYPETRQMTEDPDFVDTLKSLGKSGDLARIETALRSDKNIATYAAVSMQYARLEKMDPEARDKLFRKQAERQAEESRREAEIEERMRIKKREEEARAKADKLEKELAAMTPTQRQGRALKDAGNAKFKARDFSGALKEYEAAFLVDATDVTYLTNAAACHLELGDAESCIRVSEQAIALAREQRASFSVIARALQRLGSAYLKQGDYARALDTYKKSLVEERTSETLALLKKAEKLKEEADAKAMLNPELAAQAKEEGNTLFKAAKYPEAVAKYSEAIKRAPSEAAYYTNRATAYTKLLAYPEAFKDLDKAIALKPDFIKAYVKKAHLHTVIKEYNKALETYDKAMKHDPENEEVAKGVQQVVQLINGGGAGGGGAGGGGGAPDDETVRRNVSRDPELQRILRDPRTQTMLQEVQRDPTALDRVMADPVLSANFNKLLAAGVLRQG